MALNLSEAKVKITAQTAGQEQIDALKRKIEGIGDSVKGIGEKFEGLKKLFAAGLFAEAVRGVAEFIGKSIDLGDELNDMSMKFGVSVEALSTFMDAGATAGASLDTIGTAFKKLSVNTVEAAAGNKKAAAVFKTLGLSVKDTNGQLKDAGDLALDVADKFKAMADGPEKAAIAVKLFGKSGQDMIPTLNMGRDGILEFGSTISTQFAQAADAFNDRMEMMKIKVRNLSIQGATQLMPTLLDITGAFMGLTEQGPNTTTFFEDIGELARLTALALGEVYFSIMDVGGALATKAQQAWEIAHGNWDKVKQLQAERDAAQGARERKEKDFLAKLTANSFIFGSGTVAQIRARQIASIPKGGTPVGNNRPDISGLSSEDKKEKKDPFGDAMNSLGGSVAKLQFQIANFAKYGEAVDSAQGALLRFETTSGKFKDFSTEQKAALVAEADKIDELTKQYKALEQHKKDVAELTKDTASWQNEIQALNDEAASVGMTAFAYKQLVDRRKALLDIEQKTAAMKERGSSQTDIDNYRNAAVQAFNDRQALEQRMEARNQSFGGASQNAFAEYARNISNMGESVKNAWTNALSGTEDALVNFVQTGKLSFKDLANSIISDLIRIAIQQAIMAPLTGWLKGLGLFAANGAAFDSGGVRKFATGGVVTRPTMFAHSGGLGLMGEAGPEAIMPLRRLGNGRLGIEAAGGGGGGTQNVTVNVNVEGGGSQVSGDPGTAAQLGNIVAKAVQAELIVQKRPGGLLAA